MKDKKSLYNFKNGIYIYCCIGTTDKLVNVDDKEQSFNNLDYIHFEVINQQKIDGTIFKSTNHGLDAVFFKTS